MPKEKMPCQLPIYVINLRRRADRRAWIEEHLRRINLDFTFFDATDVRDLDHDPLARLYDPIRFFKHNPGQPEISPGLVACSLSHYRIWQHVAASGAPWTLVLEDDALFTMGNPAPLVEAAAAVAVPNGVVLLNSRCHGVWLRKRTTLAQKPHTLYFVNSETHLAAAYLLSVGAAQRLAAAVTRNGIICGNDWWFRDDGADWSRLVPIQVMKPDLVAQHVEMGSDIITVQNEKYFDWVHDNAHRELTLLSGLVRNPRNPRYWPLLASRGLRRMYGFYRMPPRCLE